MPSPEAASAAVRPARPVARRARRRRRGALHRFGADLAEAVARVARKTHWPTWPGIAGYLGHQALANTLAWTAGVVTAELTKRYFEVRGLRNAWGLFASRHRTLVSADDYELILTVASYTAGLVMLMVVRHLVLRVITEFHGLRSERRRGAAPRRG